MKKKFIYALTLGALLVSVASCGQTEEPTPGPGPDNQVTKPIEINSTLASLRQGFKVTGTLKVDTTYFTDSTYQVPDTTLSPTSTTYKFTLTFQDNNNYQGVDRRYYEVSTDENGNEYDAYLLGENSFNLDGYAGLNYLDYANKVQTGYAIDTNEELIPYASNGLVNPFKLITRGDFIQTTDGFELSHTKASLLFTTFFSQLESYIPNVSFETRLFDFDEETLNSAHLVSANMNSSSAATVENDTDPYHQTWERFNYDLTLNFSDIGTANAKDLIKSEPEKEENEPLANALANMANSNEITYQRIIHPYIDGEYVGEDTGLSVYYMGDDGIYSQAYNLEAGETTAPSEPSASDYLLRQVTSTNPYLRVYQYNGSTFTQNASGYSNLDNLYTYKTAYLSFANISPNIFNINEDGSYSPTDDNIPYITRELFMSRFDSFTPVDSGYVNSVKIYVDEEENCIDRIVVLYEDFVGYSGTMTIYFSQLGDSHPAFEIELA